MANVADFLSQELYEGFVSDVGNRKPFVAAKLKKAIQNGLLVFLGAMRDEGRLGAVNGAGHLSLKFVEAWNSFVKGDCEEVDVYGTRIFRMGNGEMFHLETLLEPAYYRLIGQAVREASYETACDLVNRGNMGPFEWPDTLTCQSTGAQISPTFSDWKLSLTTCVNGVEVPVGRESVPAIVPLFHGTVNFPTGRLIAADWIRIEGFKEHCRALEGKESITTVVGCAERTRRYLEDGIVHVFVGNTSPTIGAGLDGLVLAGYPKFDEEQENDEDEKSVAVRSETLMNEMPSICTDMWWATFIDEQRLVEILTPVHGEEEARYLIEEYVEKNFGVHRITVEPGVHHLYHAGIAERFAAHFPADAMDHGQPPELISPMAVLANRSLDLGCEVVPAPATTGPR